MNGADFTRTAPSGLSKPFRAASTASPADRAALVPTAKAPARRKRPAPFSLRLTQAERTRLERESGETPLATYIKLRLFNNLPDLATFTPARPGGRPATDTQLIAKLLAALGDSRIASNLNQLAKHANMGNLPLYEGAEGDLQEACAAVQSMRRDLVAALGLRPKAGG